jgi:hypothetical protein
MWHTAAFYSSKEGMMIYEVSVKKSTFATARVEANSLEEALDLAEDLSVGELEFEDTVDEVIAIWEEGGSEPVWTA